MPDYLNELAGLLRAAAYLALLVLAIDRIMRTRGPASHHVVERAGIAAGVAALGVTYHVLRTFDAPAWIQSTSLTVLAFSVAYMGLRFLDCRRDDGVIQLEHDEADRT